MLLNEIKKKKPLVGQGPLIMKASRPHSDLPYSVGLLWTIDQPDAETSTWSHTHITRDYPVIPENEWPQTHALKRADTGIGNTHPIRIKCVKHL